MMKKDKTKRTLSIQKLINITNVIKSRGTLKECEVCKAKSGPCPHCKQVIIDINGINSFPINIPKKRRFFSKDQEFKEPELDIYDPSVTLQKLYNERDNYIQQIIEYRDMTIGLTDDYNEESNEWIKSNQNKNSIFNWLKI